MQFGLGDILTVRFVTELSREGGVMGDALKRQQQIRILLKWTGLVWLNAAVSFFLALEQHRNAADVLGIVCGVFSFVFLYAAVDYLLLLRNRQKLRKMLLIGVILKALTQLYPVIEMLTGLLALKAAELIMPEIRFLTVYLVTVIDGVLLSLLVMMFMGLIKLWSMVLRWLRGEAGMSG